MGIVNTNINYTYEEMMSDISILNKTYPFIQIDTVGYSVLGRAIPVIKLGVGKKHVFYSGSYHANEWITSTLLMKFIEDFCEAFVSKKDILGYKISYLFANTTIYIIPMVNPDGVDFVTNFFPVNSKIYRNFQYIARNFSSIPFPNGWKANFNGVDLNLQFPANWEMAKKIKYSQGFSKPAPRDFPGYRSFNRARKFSNI